MDAEPDAGAPPDASLYRLPVTPLRWLMELRQARGLVVAFSVRELQARYKHAVLGCLWAFLVPLVFMLVFTAVFTRVADFDTNGAPYAVFTYIGLLVWTFFSTSVTLASQSLVSNSSLLNRVYFPREVLPLGAIGVALTDAAVALPAFAVLLVLTGASFALSPADLPVVLVLGAILLAWTIGIALLVGAAVVYLRDVRQLLPIALQLGLIATPVVYGFDAIPAWLRPWYSLANPLGPVIDGFRRVLLDGAAPEWPYVGLATIAAVVTLGAGYVAFKRLEVGFADLA